MNIKISLILSLMFFLFLQSTYATSVTKPVESTNDLKSTKSAQATTAPTDIPPTSQISSNDPLYGLNHAMFTFNENLDRYVLKPVATLYDKIMPRPLHHGITNFFNNIDNLPTVINDVLQFNFYQAVSDSWRLIVNTTVGILGFFDVAKHIGLEQNHEDFGLTLARWGYTDSNYLVVPFFGPGTIRDVIGWPIDYFFFSIYPSISNSTVRYSLYGVGVVDKRANLLQYQNFFEQAAVDKYSFMRNAYLQHRKYLIERNKELGNPYLEEGVKGPEEI